MRSFHGSKCNDFYIMEQERSDWMGPFQSHGKTNYVEETCSSHEVFYNPDRSDYSRENDRTNRMNVLHIGGHTVTYDELNEFIMDWLKAGIKSVNKDKVRP